MNALFVITTYNKHNIQVGDHRICIQLMKNAMHSLNLCPLRLVLSANCTLVFKNVVTFVTYILFIISYSSIISTLTFIYAGVGNLFD